MKNIIASIILLLIVTNLFSQGRNNDWRYLPNGNLLHADTYVDQPYVTILDNGSWLCVYTTNAAHEGAKGQHVACRVSRDKGITWGENVRIEEPGTESKSWGMPYKTRYGRVYVFYSYNGAKIHELGEKKNIREDMLGWYCYKYSDDGGKTWSGRYRLPMRKSAVDYMNQWNGDVQIFWGVGKPVRVDKGMMFGFTRIGEYMLEFSEGWFYFCGNIEREKDPDKLKWKLLPEGDHGVRSPAWGSIQAEHCIMQLHNGDLYTSFRTTQGVPLESYSKDKGKSWSDPEPMKDYLERNLRNPRANTKIWKSEENGKYLLWYHNHGEKNFYHRNPAWISAGIEKDGKIIWSQPEILLYKDLEARGMSYPDLIQQDGQYWVTQTEKTEARCHKIPNEFLDKLWQQHDFSKAETKSLKVDWTGDKTSLQFDKSASISISMKDSVKLPTIQPVDQGDGFTVTARLKLNLDMAKGTILIDSRDENGKGFWMETGDYYSVKFSISDGNKTSEWVSDMNILQVRSHREQEVTVIADFRAKIIMFVADGVLSDGGNYRAFGWGRIDKDMKDVSTEWLKIDKRRKTITKVQFFDRPLMVTEAVGNYRAWRKSLPVDL